jgi:hypothetical protein
LGHARTPALCAPRRGARRRGREQGQLRNRRGETPASGCRVDQRPCEFLDAHVARRADGDFQAGRSPGRPNPPAVDRGLAGHRADCVAACDVPSCWGAGS